MSLHQSQPASAQVVLRPAAGHAPGAAEVTAANVAQYLPQAQSAAAVQQAFRDAGFQTSELVGNSFSITAPPDRFEEYFGVRLDRDASAGLRALQEEGAAADELPLDRLPGWVAAPIQMVALVPPPDFGPTSYSGFV
ncbi:MAG TPA: hypothetical protein VHG08_18975 [Longimicrobium sp.]|nr:hypothetical protein [Longimicrobium sp.]